MWHNEYGRSTWTQEKKERVGSKPERYRNDVGTVPEVNWTTQKFDLIETTNSSDGYMQIHNRCFTYLVNLAKTKRVAYFMPT